MSKRNGRKYGAYPSASVIFSTTLALLVAGLFGILMTISKELERLVQDNVRIQVYMRTGLNDSTLQAFGKKLEKEDFVNRSSVDPISFISRDDAARKFIRETGEDFYKFMGENPLHDSYIVAVAIPWQQPGKLEALKKRLERFHSVHFVDYNPSLIDSINRNRNIAGAVLLGCAVALFAVVVLLIRNTVRLALYSQRFIIRSMQLVGATRGFISRPFLLRAAGYGLTGGIIASGLLAGLLAGAVKRFPDLQAVMNTANIAGVLGILSLLGIFVAVLSTWRALYHFLGLSLDELY
ncbi:MAG: cell division protein FtsX [Bacteroidota bacterium]